MEPITEVNQRKLYADGDVLDIVMVSFPGGENLNVKRSENFCTKLKVAISWSRESRENIFASDLKSPGLKCYGAGKTTPREGISTFLQIWSQEGALWRKTWFSKQSTRTSKMGGKKYTASDKTANVINTVEKTFNFIAVFLFLVIEIS